MSASRILVVDDEPDIANALKVGLRGYGFKVDSFDDSVEALKNFKPGMYDVIVSDVKMPVMNGFEMVYEMQKIDPNCEVLFLTGHIDMYRELSRLFERMKVREVLQKPMEIQRLAEKIKAVKSIPPLTSSTADRAQTLELLTKELKKEEVKSSQPRPRKELLELIMTTLEHGRGTLANISQRMRPKLEFTWDEFLDAINYLLARGQIESKGDGFEVLFSLTESGERAARP
jgi:DNA-binding NtrC family response regulator